MAEINYIVILFNELCCSQRYPTASGIGMKRIIDVDRFLMKMFCLIVMITVPTFFGVWSVRFKKIIH